MVNAHADASAAASPKLSSVAAMEPMMIENSSQERNVRSAAKKTLGSTRMGTWMPVIIRKIRQRIGQGREKYVNAFGKKILVKGGVIETYVCPWAL